MLYRKYGKTNEMVSILGYGCMRLPVIPGGDPSKIDDERAIKLLRYAIDQGVNYIDTAYVYHGSAMGKAGESEPFVARALEGGYREKVKIATKLPCWMVNSREDMDRLLNEQLERLKTKSIDFYLAHSLSRDTWDKMKELGIGDFMNNAIKDGRIKHAGFSFHDKVDVFKEIVDYYDWSFCQIQYNYLDQDFQAGTEGLKYAAGKGLGVAIMEPLRGGNLANVSDDVREIFKSGDTKRSPAAWGLRWLWNKPEVSVVLSGMNEMEQLTDNIQMACQGEANSMSEAELAIVEEVRASMDSKIKVRCTGCEYCLPCPKGVMIPDNFRAYNDYYVFGRKVYWMPSSAKAFNCVQCGNCEKHCPQGIHIREELKNVKALFEE